MADLPNAVVKRLLTKHGGGLRVSGSAVDKAVQAAEDYIARFGELAKQSNTMILPSNAADVAAMIGTAMKVIEKSRPGTA